MSRIYCQPPLPLHRIIWPFTSVNVEYHIFGAVVVPFLPIIYVIYSHCFCSPFYLFKMGCNLSYCVCLDDFHGWKLMPEKCTFVVVCSCCCLRTHYFMSLLTRIDKIWDRFAELPYVGLVCSLCVCNKLYTLTNTH